MAKRPTGLLQRLHDNEYVICAEGYVFEFERRGYLQAGAFVPEVVIEHPELVQQLHEEFVHAGSDVVEAFTYYGHRAKLQVIKRESDNERLNRQALKIARTVADNTGTLMAGNICNTGVYDPAKQASIDTVHAIFQEQITWAVEGGADFIVGETFGLLGEALLAAECIKRYGNGLPSVVNMCLGKDDNTYEGVPIADALRKLQAAGADVVGLNCHRGPRTMLPAIRAIRQAIQGPLACLPVPYRTNESAVTMPSLKDPLTGEESFPTDLDMWLCSRKDIEIFTKGCMDLGVNYLGICCGNRSCYTRVMAETLGRRPPASKYSPDMSKHISRVQGEEHQTDHQNWASKMQ